jgi:uncharacterized protein YecE (DUF72 family)
VSAAPAVFVGTSGYSFADWVGPFYPPGTKSADYLAHYARQFGCVEVNSTYYGIPQPRVMEQMQQKTPAGFRFLVKLNQAMTHAGAQEPALYQRFLEAVQPLKDAGKYKGLLAQFPWAFRREARTKAHLELLRERLPDEPLWVEFRHASWMHPQLPAWLAERQLGYCAVDEPALPGLVPPVTHVTNGVGYVRFHGRNAKHWWGSGADMAAGTAGTNGGARAPVQTRGSREQLRYDYDYSERELTEWLARVNAMAQQAKQTYLFFNNCHAGQAARNAKLMEELLRRSGSLL